MQLVNGDVVLEHPSARDGAAVWRLIRDAGGLDLNACYAYLLLCDRFADSCLVARDAHGLCGVVLGVQTAARPNTLFIWQVAVAARARKTGLGLRLLQALAGSDRCRDVCQLEAHVAPDNVASTRLFRAFARAAGATLKVEDGYGAGDFAEPHAAERLFRIGPLRASSFRDQQAAASAN